MATLTCYLNDADYRSLRLASMQGKFSDNFVRSEGGDVTFKTSDPHKLCRDLDGVIDAGATTWHDVFGILPSFA